MRKPLLSTSSHTHIHTQTHPRTSTHACTPTHTHAHTHTHSSSTPSTESNGSLRRDSKNKRDRREGRVGSGSRQQDWNVLNIRRITYFHFKHSMTNSHCQERNTLKSRTHAFPIKQWKGWTIPDTLAPHRCTQGHKIIFPHSCTTWWVIRGGDLKLDQEREEGNSCRLPWQL